MYKYKYKHTITLIKSNKRLYNSDIPDNYVKVENLVLGESIPTCDYSKEYNSEEFASENWLNQFKEIKLYKKYVFYIQVVWNIEPVVLTYKVTFMCTETELEDYYHTALWIRCEIYDILDDRFGLFIEKRGGSCSHRNKEFMFKMFY